MATIGELIQKYGVEYIGRYYSNYRGVVIDNVDPNNMGRIFVMLPGIHDGVRTWARPKAMPGGLKYGLKWITPRIGEVVWVEFENGDPLKAIWSYYGWTMGDIPDELQDGNTVGFITPSGNKVYLQDIDGKLKVSINTEIGIEIPEGVNLVKKHVKPNGQNETGGIIEIEAPLKDGDNSVVVAEAISQALSKILSEQEEDIKQALKR